MTDNSTSAIMIHQHGNDCDDWTTIQVHTGKVVTGADISSETLAWLALVVLPRLQDAGCYVMGEEIAALATDGHLAKADPLSRTFTGNALADFAYTAGDVIRDCFGEPDTDGDRTEPLGCNEALDAFAELGGFMTSIEADCLATMQTGTAEAA